MNIQMDSELVFFEVVYMSTWLIYLFMTFDCYWFGINIILIIEYRLAIIILLNLLLIDY